MNVSPTAARDESTDAAPTTIGEDLAFLRSVAEQGRRTFESGGLYLALWGVVIAGAYLNNYLALLHAEPSLRTIGAGYLMSGAVGWAGSTLLARRDARASGPRTFAGRLFGVVFATAGAVVSLFAVSAAFSPAIIEELIVIVAAQMMGLCFVVTGRISHRPLLVAVGALWLAASISLPYYISTPEFYLVGAGLWVALLAAPGLVLEALRRRRQKEASDVLATTCDSNLR